MNELESKHVAPYLPFDLKVKYKNNILVMEGIYTHKDIFTYENADIPFSEIKPILRPLSDLTKEIEHNGERFVPDLWFKDKPLTMYFEDDFLRGITRRDSSYTILQCSYNVLSKLFEWHFDVFGLIEKGLAIDINTLERDEKR